MLPQAVWKPVSKMVKNNADFRKLQKILDSEKSSAVKVDFLTKRIKERS